MPFQAVRDLNMHYLEHGDPGGAPVLLIHGNVSSSAWWQYTLDRLSGSPYRLIAPDLRGRGQTEGPADDWTIETLAQDIRGLVEALQLGKVHLVGHSLGALVAIQYALDYKPEVRSLFLLAPGWVAGDMPAEVADPNRIRMMVENKAILKAALRMTAANHPEAGWEVLESAGLRQQDAASYRTPIALKQWAVASRLRELDGIPTTVARGVHDSVIPESVVLASAQGIPHARYEVIEGATHSPNVEVPDAFVALLRAHLERAS
ncbi:MAG: alpha/beta hydrolase [Candidatus Thermofonsia Clade 1 bacterium]|jgi:pimeloyl-ACP methyl ester carboxylesterase|uniref:Alpha/beta hydrolase n=1 Tax=Candidatus Thermofonsia Clade 1 bacterium TaxID=2364210 RepID=A0A2M8PYC3_9CHLR|nr:MAG: alpha/beta hydrolase [Candidatus Thermofonsia Clade 1 bacterium]PJF42520.1 MAG: alpha/beta hydrolase [Candidatus Thermofonsia Clade 1 bacterium]